MVGNFAAAQLVSVVQNMLSGRLGTIGGGDFVVVHDTTNHPHHVQELVAKPCICDELLLKKPVNTLNGC